MSNYTTSVMLPSTNGGTAHVPVQNKPIILHLGDDIRFDHETHNRLRENYDVRKPRPEELERSAFIRNLESRKWGAFSAIFRPFWATGNEMRKWDRELIELLPKEMKVMASAGAGYEWVDTECLAEHGILYCNGAGASTEAVADMALYFIIDVFRNMTRSFRAAISKQPRQWQEAHDGIPATSYNPRDKSLAIVGFGNIGTAIAKKARFALGMHIMYNDLYQKPKDEKEVDATFYKEFKDILPPADCIVIATPSTGQPLLDAHTISLLPRGARVVNVARGSVIDETALADALDSGHISAAALDVHAHEPEVNHRLAQMPNVQLTCHTGGGSVNTIKGFEKLAMENVELVLQGKPPRTAVNAARVQTKGSIHAHDSNGVLDHGDQIGSRHQTDTSMHNGTNGVNGVH